MPSRVLGSPDSEHAVAAALPEQDVLPDSPNEHTRLLSPDDPRVTPLNNSNVKALRFCLHALLVVNLAWLVLSLLSYFVSIPGFDSHGKSFIEFSFVFASLYVNFLSYVFFLIPLDLSVDRWLNYGCLAMLVFDLLLILVFPFQRAQHGFSEYLTLLFAIFSVGLNLVSNTYVLAAKKTEEVRLTGREETRKTLAEHLSIGTEFVLKLALIAYLFAASLNIALKCVDSAVVQPWGLMVAPDDAPYRIHLFCEGDVYGNSTSHQPIVLVESGHESSEDFASWIQELHILNRVDRYCIYDRPGYGFSDSSPSPYSLGVNSDMLAGVLRNQGIEGPFLIASHGIGGLYSRVFATRHINSIHSLMLVDAWLEELLLPNPFSHAKNSDQVLPREIPKLNRRYGFSVWLHGVFSAVNLRGFFDLIVHRFGSGERIFGRDMYIQGKYLRALLQEQVLARILSYNDISLAKEALNDADKQVSVVSSKFLIKQSLNWGNWQRDMTKISSNSHNEWVLTESGYESWRYSDGKKKLQKLLLRMLGESDQL